MADAHPDYPYAPDRFDREAESTSFHGAHRAEDPFWRQNLLYIIVIAAAVLLLLVLLFVIGGMGKGAHDDRATPAATTSQATSAPASDGGGAETKADRSTPVLVVNAGGQKGMAATWKKELEGKGWSKVDVETAKGRQEQPVVFYKDEKDAATANQLAQDAGIDGGAQQSDEYDARITILVVDAPQG